MEIPSVSDTTTGLSLRLESALQILGGLLDSRACILSHRTIVRQIRGGLSRRFPSLQRLQ